MTDIIVELLLIYDDYDNNIISFVVKPYVNFYTVIKVWVDIICVTNTIKFMNYYRENMHSLFILKYNMKTKELLNLRRYYLQYENTKCMF